MNKLQRQWHPNVQCYGFKRSEDGNIKIHIAKSPQPEQAPRYLKNKLTNSAFANRSCYCSPDQNDFAQYAAIDNSNQIILNELLHTELYENLLAQQYGLGLELKLDNIEEISSPKEMKISSSEFNDGQNSLEAIDDKSASGADVCDIKLQNEDEIVGEKILVNDATQISPNRSKTSSLLPKNVYISESPRIKKIAEQFSKYKTGNIELRRLEERIVCLEYDVYDLSNEKTVPVEKMRAYFSLQPSTDRTDSTDAIPTKDLLSNIKIDLKMANKKLYKKSYREIEIIDAKIYENQPYLDDLRRILRRKNITNLKKKKDSLDLNCLYEMARKQSLLLGNTFASNVFTKAELQDVKDLILKQCTSSVHGISRKKLKSNGDFTNTISQSIVAELMKMTTP